MFQIDLKSRKAIYAQIIDNFKRLIITGVLKPEDKVPSIRDLAQTITVNPNTVQKAYRELETQGYIYTVLGQGSFIAVPDNPAPEVEALYIQLKAIVQELLFRGQKLLDITEIIQNLHGFDDNDESD
ncbi:MAG: GntR family transcriptional regulator [Defluviitaleaceae bacterium]|nr:GntR family transcriptional regulator [Defluviitaleaceae bacterium]